MSTTQQEIDQIMEVCENLQNSPDVSRSSSEEQIEVQNDSDPLNKIYLTRDVILKIDYLRYKLLMDQELIIKSQYLLTNVAKMVENIEITQKKIEAEFAGKSSI